jgi:hypothetical protein
MLAHTRSALTSAAPVRMPMLPPRPPVLGTQILPVSQLLVVKPWTLSHSGRGQSRQSQPLSSVQFLLHPWAASYSHWMRHYVLVYHCGKVKEMPDSERGLSKSGSGGTISECGILLRSKRRSAGKLETEPSVKRAASSYLKGHQTGTQTTAQVALPLPIGSELKAAGLKSDDGCHYLCHTACGYFQLGPCSLHSPLVANGPQLFRVRESE